MTESIATINDTVEKLYQQGKVCLTAHKDAEIDKKYRPYLALFANGTFLVDERAKDDAVLQNMVLEFYKNYPSNKRTEKQYVSTDLLKAVYQKAQNFDWYEPQFASWKNLSQQERSKIRQLQQSIKHKTCLSITTITTPQVFRFYSPDKGKFALFADGRLILAENSPYPEELPRMLSNLYPETNLVEIVPDYCVEAVYDYLLYRHPSAREIYIGLCRQKISKRLKISADEAQQVMQKQVSGWRKLLFLDEKTARSMIYSEFVEQSLAAADENWSGIMANKKEYKIGVFL